jgi:hypothetical protein
MPKTPVQTPTEQEETVRRVLASGVFQKSPKLREFLVYSAEHSLKGQRDLLSEQHIGVAVLGRTPGYNPGDDSIVRVQARNLREKLAEYFAGQGSGEPTVITVPKGRYDLVLSPRPTPPEECPSAAEPIAAEERAPKAAVHGPGRSRPILVGGALAVAAFALGLAVPHFGAARVDVGANPAPAEGRDRLVANSILTSVFAPPT